MNSDTGRRLGDEESSSRSHFGQSKFYPVQSGDAEGGGLPQHKPCVSKRGIESSSASQAR
jgi:hypothetical protein